MEFLKWKILKKSGVLLNLFSGLDCGMFFELRVGTSLSVFRGAKSNFIPLFSKGFVQKYSNIQFLYNIVECIYIYR